MNFMTDFTTDRLAAGAAGLCFAAVFATAAAYPVSNQHPGWQRTQPMAGNVKPALVLSVRPRQAFPPVKVTTEVRQVQAHLEGQEVCVVLQGPESMVSCWQHDQPPALVVREFTLHSGGVYEVFARGGGLESNHLTVNVVTVN